MPKVKELKIVKIKSYDHFTHKLEHPYDVEDATAIMISIGELYKETDIYYILRSARFMDEDKDDIGHMYFQWVLKSTVIHITQYSQE